MNTLKLRLLLALLAALPLLLAACGKGGGGY
jgi:predicted small secreted protein